MQAVQRLGNAKVEKIGTTFSVDKQVAEFEIPVHDQMRCAAETAVRWGLPEMWHQDRQSPERERRARRTVRGRMLTSLSSSRLCRRRPSLSRQRAARRLGVSCARATAEPQPVHYTARRFAGQWAHRRAGQSCDFGFSTRCRTTTSRKAAGLSSGTVKRVCLRARVARALR